MDTVSQFALGAALGVAVMGRTQSPLKSALIGGAPFSRPSNVVQFTTAAPPVSVRFSSAGVIT